MKIVRDENQHSAFEEKYVVYWKKKFEIQKVMLIYFEFRTLFDLKNKKTSTIKRCFWYLNKVIATRTFYFYTRTFSFWYTYTLTLIHVHSIKNDKMFSK